MPLSPTPAQSQASRANGALSRGPATDAGKARSAANAPAPSHGLRGTGPFAFLPGEDPAAFDDLLADHHLRPGRRRRAPLGGGGGARHVAPPPAARPESPRPRPPAL